MLDIDKFMEKLPEGDRLEFRAAWHSELAAALDGDEKVRPKQGEHDPAFRAILILETLLGELKEAKKKAMLKCDFKLFCSYVVSLGLEHLPLSPDEIQQKIITLEIQATEAKLRNLQAALAKDEGKSLIAAATKMQHDFKASAQSETKNASQSDVVETDSAQS